MTCDRFLAFSVIIFSIAVFSIASPCGYALFLENIQYPCREVRDSGRQGWVRVKIQNTTGSEIKRGGEESNKEVLLRENTIYPWREREREPVPVTVLEFGVTCRKQLRHIDL